MTFLARTCVLLGDRPAARRLAELMQPFSDRNAGLFDIASLGPIARELDALTDLIRASYT